MLYLNPPYFVIKGVSVFPDEADPLQFYYLPMMPHLTMVTDPASNVSLPQLQLIEYTGSAGSGGFLNFDVNIGISDELLAEVASQVQNQLSLSGTPRLSPVTFVDGTVKLVLLGAQSADPPPAPGSGPSAPVPTAPAPPPGTPQFVLKIQNAAKPALYGDNQATFSVQLDQYGATILQQALQGQMAPVAVIYSLQFLGLRPAFKVHMTVDWNRVQTSLDQSYSGGFLFFSSDIEKSVDKLIEDKVIQISVDTYVTDGDLGTGASSDRDRAVAECYELIKTNFFESSLQPPQPGDKDTFGTTFRNISDIAVTGGAAALASFSYKSTDLSRTDKKSLDFTMTERTSVMRTIYPQGHLAGLLQQLKDQGIGLDQFVLKVDLDNPFFQRRKVTVLSHADFDGDSIASINVDLTYNGIVKSVGLQNNTTQTEVDWTSLLANGQMVRPVTYTYTVVFKDVDTTQRPGELTSGTLTMIGDFLDIEPRVDLYGVTVIPIRAFGLPFDRYPSVEVECRYIDAANGIHLQPSAVLNSATPQVNWPLFMVNPSLRSFDYRLTYTLAAGGTSIGAWVTTDDGKIDIWDPFPTKISLNIVAALNWSVFAEALVFVAYPNKDNPVAQQTYTLTMSNASAPPFEVDRQVASQTAIYYEVQLIRSNGQIWKVPGSVTTDRYLILQDKMPGHQIVTIVPEQVDFAAMHLTEIDVNLRYVDTANAVNLSATVSLTSRSDVRDFAYDFLSGQIQPEYSASIQMDNGQTKNIDWTPISGSMLTIPLSQFA